MVSRILAFRPASVVERLAPRSDACPLSLRDLLGPASALGIVLPVVRAPIAGVARAALVAAKEHRSALGLALPPGVLPEPWFDAVTRTADELAAGLPIFLSAEVKVDGDGATQVERALHEAWRLVDAGVTHLAIDVVAVERLDRARVVAEVAAAAFERGICVDCVLPLEDGAQARAAALLEELSRRGATPDVASVRCPAPASPDEARLQVAALARVCGALSGVPVMRRGPATPDLLRLLEGSPVKACDDGGLAAASAIGVIPWDLIVADEGEDESRANRLEQAARELSDEGADRLEARAYLEVMQFLEALGAPGSALQLSRVLERQLEDR
ncbi:hypothetical protein [Anaeromyxobacter oryzae]|uniref:Uncharacterized protein n=1 Tax=Anaeromyxobacter oryzae TaxID=2918170 RepID=A0ABM7X480_9BACT|nr:hypothetical protein [Anaeromyxobacter oryzae]BDG06608.1 hypothetical protein AMOR_56040 [Anaeromyxobacter oryzae]